MKKIRLILLFYICGAFNTYASCPTSLSKDKVITLSRIEPAFEEKYELKDGNIFKTVKYLRNGQPYSTIQRIMNGLIVVEHTRKKHTLNVLYKNDHNEISTLPETKIWRSEIDIFKNGKLIKSGEDILEFIQSTKITINDCSYEAWEIKSTTVFGEKSKTHFVKYYSPELKIVLKTIHYNDETRNSPISEITFDTIK